MATKKQQVAKHFFQDADDRTVDIDGSWDGMPEGTDLASIPAPIRYVYHDIKTKQEYTVELANVHAKAILMYALFGIKTHMTNYASQVRNGKIAPQYEGLAGGAYALERMKCAIEDGLWPEKITGPRGPQYDYDVLATAFCDWFEGAKGRRPDEADIAKKLAEDSAFRQRVVNQPDTMAAYAAAVNKATGVDDFDDLGDDEVTE